MAKTPENVMSLLEPVWERAREKAVEDKAELARIAAADGSNQPIAGWDWRYYSEKLRAERYAFDESELKPYLQLDNVIAAAFDVAGRLFGLRFEERSDITAWHEDVRTFEVRDADGSFRAMFLADYFNRPTKRSGAWMSRLQSGHRLGDGQHPIVYNVMNFAKPPIGQKALLSMDEARTLFHEFGHALHGMLTDVTWPSISGTSVSRDFVELPSQLYEHWLTVPSILEKHARHYQTGTGDAARADREDGCRKDIRGRLRYGRVHCPALVDMAFHARAEAPADPLAFEAETLKQLKMPDAIAMRHGSPHFLHVFSGDGYSAATIPTCGRKCSTPMRSRRSRRRRRFDPGTAKGLRDNIYAAGGSRDRRTSIVNFAARCHGRCDDGEAGLV